MNGDDHDRWPELAFSELYSDLYSHRDDESARRETDMLLDLLGCEGSARILDAACGDGRHLASLLSRGLDAFGIDLSPSLLRRAAGRGQLAGRLARADMRSIPFVGSFDIVVNMFTSFGYFLRDEDNRAVVLQLAGCLVPEGRLVLDHINRSHVVSTLRPESRRSVDGRDILESRRIEGGRVVKSVVELVSEGPGRELYVESVRVYEPEEMIELLESAGLVDVRLAGYYDGRPLESDSTRMVALARKT